MVKPEDAPSEPAGKAEGSSDAARTLPTADAKDPPAKPVTQGFAHLFKYVLVGDSGTGKTSLLRRYATDSFDEQHVPTIGVDFNIKTVSLPNGDRVKLQLWDTAGQERYRNITTSYYRGATGVIITYDVTKRETADNVKLWLRECLAFTSEDIKMVVIGTKCDLKDSARDYVTLHKVKSDVSDDAIVGFFEVSAKTGEGVEQAVQCLTDALVEERIVKRNNLRGATTKIGQKNKDKKTISLKDEEKSSKKKCC